MEAQLGIGQELRRLARWHGKTFLQVSRESGISYDRVVRILRGERAPRPEELQALAKVLGADEAAR